MKTYQSTEDTQKSHTSLAELSEDGSILLAGQKLWLVPAEKTDRAFVISTWVKSYLPTARKKLAVEDAVYFDNHPKIAERLWDRAMVLRDEDDGSAIMAYVVVDENSVVHYIYIVPELRGMGLVDVLIKAVVGAETPVIVSHRWPYKDRANWQYNPYAAWRHVCV